MKNILTFIVLFLSNNLFAQLVDDKITIENMKSDIKSFFVSKGEINIKNQLEIKAINVYDSTDLGYYKKGIYIIRTVYRTDGNDYLFFKNDKKHEILDLKNLKLAISKTLELFNDSSDEEIYLQIQCLLKWYDGSYLATKRSRKVSRK